MTESLVSSAEGLLRLEDSEWKAGKLWCSRETDDHASAAGNAGEPNTAEHLVCRVVFPATLRRARMSNQNARKAMRATSSQSVGLMHCGISNAISYEVGFWKTSPRSVAVSEPIWRSSTTWAGQCSSPYTVFGLGPQCHY